MTSLIALSILLAPLAQAREVVSEVTARYSTFTSEGETFAGPDSACYFLVTKEDDGTTSFLLTNTNSEDRDPSQVVAYVDSIDGALPLRNGFRDGNVSYIEGYLLAEQKHDRMGPGQSETAEITLEVSADLKKIKTAKLEISRAKLFGLSSQIVQTLSCQF